MNIKEEWKDFRRGFWDAVIGFSMAAIIIVVGILMVYGFRCLLKSWG